MTKPISLLAVLLGALLLAGCQIYIPDVATRIITGSGQVRTEERAVSGFRAVSLSGAGLVTITQGDAESLTVEADDNLLPLIETLVQDGTLIIRVKREDWRYTLVPTRPIKFDLHVKELAALEVSGAADVQANKLKSDRFNLTISGAGNIKLDQLDAQELATTIGGAGNVEVAGSVVTQVANLSGLGNYRAAKLNSQNAQITVSGAGSATIRASETLHVSISGAGSVNYYGNPVVRRTVAGVGVVKRLGDN
ncbi:MAG: DUF2807 domain-containing protein [Chloroflexi bacterium]|nr:DUF2807 domain-containing protein [Chloroflexota bacterium]